MNEKQEKPKIGKDWISVLMMMVQELHLNEVPRVSSVVQKIALKQDHNSAEKLVKRLAGLYYKNKLSPNHFASFEDELDGEILVGTTDNGKKIGLNKEELVRHVFISGQSGFGKSNLIKHIFLQAKEQKIHTVHIDRKGDLEHLVRQGVDSFYWQDIRTNFLCPPDCEVNIYEYRNDFVKAFSELMQFYQRGMSVFLLGVHLLYQKFDVYSRWKNWDWNSMQFPTMKDLLFVFKSKEFGEQIRGQGKESLLSIIDKLESLIIELEPIVSCRKGFDMAKLYSEKRAINYMLDGLSVEYQNFFIVAELLRYSHYFKAHGPKGTLNTLFVFDETKGIFGKQNKDSFIVKDLVSKVREWGIGLVCADQIPSEISQFLFSNIGTLIFFRHSDGMDLQRIRYSSGASVEQILSNYSLKPGQAIIRSMRFKDLHKITIPFLEAEKFISRAEVEQCMSQRLHDLMLDVITPDCNQKVSELKQDSKEDVGLLPEEKEFLRCLASDFNRPSSEIYKELGWNESKGYRVKQKLIKQGFITQVSTNLGAGGKRAQYLVPNQIVVEQFGIKLVQGRGKALHRYFQKEIAQQAGKYEFNAVIEECIGTSEGPDVGLAKNGKRIAVEVSITSKPQTEAENISKNIRLGYDFVVLTFITKQALEKTREIAGKNEKARLCLVSDFAEVVYGISL